MESWAAARLQVDKLWIFMISVPFLFDLRQADAVIATVRLMRRIPKLSTECMDAPHIRWSVRATREEDGTLKASTV